MKNPLSPEAALGTIVLLVSLPIVGALFYIFGVSVADAIEHPSRNWVFWGFVTGWLVAGVRELFGYYRRSHDRSQSSEVTE